MIKLKPVFQLFYFENEILTRAILDSEVKYDEGLTNLTLPKGMEIEQFFLAEITNLGGELIQPVVIQLKSLSDQSRDTFQSWAKIVSTKKDHFSFWCSVNKALDLISSKHAICAVVGCKGTSKRFSPDTQNKAHRVGELASLLGFHVLTGGLSGVMSKAAEGAHSARGRTLGILPGTIKKDANNYIQQVFPSGIGYARNYSIALACDVMVALNGGRGTMEEMCYALDFEKTVLSWNSWDLDEVIKIDSEEELFGYLISEREKNILTKIKEVHHDQN